MEKLNEYEVGFLEGVIDTDGSINIRRSKRYDREGSRGWEPQVRLTVSNNSVELLRKVKQIIFERTGYTTKLAHKKGSDNWEYRIYSSEVLRWLLPQLNLIVKREKQRKAIELLNLMKLGINRFTNKAYNKRLYDLLNT